MTTILRAIVYFTLIINTRKFHHQVVGWPRNHGRPVITMRVDNCSCDVTMTATAARNEHWTSATREWLTDWLPDNRVLTKKRSSSDRNSDARTMSSNMTTQCADEWRSNQTAIRHWTAVHHFIFYCILKGWPVATSAHARVNVWVTNEYSTALLISIINLYLGATQRSTIRQDGVLCVFSNKDRNVTVLRGDCNYGRSRLYKPVNCVSCGVALQNANVSLGSLYLLLIHHY